MDWNKIRNEYINGNISYRKLADKHDISLSTLTKRAMQEKWNEKRTEQRKKIEAKVQQKTAEKIAEKESDLAANIYSAANELLRKLNIAIEQTDLFIERTKIKAPTKVKDKQGNVRDAFMEKEEISLNQKDGINLESVRQIAGALKDLQSIQFAAQSGAAAENPNINIVITAATPDDIESDDDE